jgi:hypothetical protein
MENCENREYCIYNDIENAYRNVFHFYNKYYPCIVCVQKRHQIDLVEMSHQTERCNGQEYKHFVRNWCFQSLPFALSKMNASPKPTNLVLI